MTNKEAIRLIRNLSTMCEFTDAYGKPIDSDAYYEAVDMAISALQEQDSPKPKAESIQNVQNEDLILRKAAIDTVKNMRKVCDTDNIDDFYDLLIEAFAVLPSTEPELHYCRECKWSRCHIYVDKYGNTETYWYCHNWDGGTDEEGYCYKWERKTDEGFD